MGDKSGHPDHYNGKSLSGMACPQCGKWAGEVIHAETHTRKGWYCPSCGRFEVAIARERQTERIEP